MEGRSSRYGSSTNKEVLKQPGVIYDNTEIGMKVYDGLNYPLKEFVYTNLMSQRLICNLPSSVTKLLKDRDEMDRKKFIKPGNDKIMSANAAETRGSNRMSKFINAQNSESKISNSNNRNKMLSNSENTSAKYNQDLIIMKVDYKEKTLFPTLT